MGFLDSLHPCDGFLFLEPGRLVVNYIGALAFCVGGRALALRQLGKNLSPLGTPSFGHIPVPRFGDVDPATVSVRPRPITAAVLVVTLVAGTLLCIGQLGLEGAFAARQTCLEQVGSAPAEPEVMVDLAGLYSGAIRLEGELEHTMLELSRLGEISGSCDVLSYRMRMSLRSWRGEAEYCPQSALLVLERVGVLEVRDTEAGSVALLPQSADTPGFLVRKVPGE